MKCQLSKRNRNWVMKRRWNLKFFYPFYKVFRLILPFKQCRIVTPNGKSIGVSVIKDRIGRAVGLSFERRMKNDGALFVFPEEGRHFFHTQDMKYSIDIIFIDSEKKIVYIAYNQMPTEKNFPKPPVNPPTPVRYVLEIPAMKSAEYGIQIDRKIAVL